MREELRFCTNPADVSRQPWLHVRKRPGGALPRTSDRVPEVPSSSDQRKSPESARRAPPRRQAHGRARSPQTHIPARSGLRYVSDTCRLAGLLRRTGPVDGRPRTAQVPKATSAHGPSVDHQTASLAARRMTFQRIVRVSRLLLGSWRRFLTQAKQPLESGLVGWHGLSQAPRRPSPRARLAVSALFAPTMWQARHGPPGDEGNLFSPSATGPGNVVAARLDAELANSVAWPCAGWRHR